LSSSSALELLAMRLVSMPYTFPAGCPEPLESSTWVEV
jgi:hypothetical protein